MRPGKISHILRMGVSGIFMPLVVSGTGLCMGSGVAHAQRNQQPPKMPPYMQPGANNLPADQPAIAPDPMRVKLDADRMKALNDDRHKKLAADVDRLVSLTNELKTDVDKTTKDQLSLDVIKKAQEIEKLAHDVQSRMKN